MTNYSKLVVTKTERKFPYNIHQNQFGFTAKMLLGENTRNKMPLFKEVLTDCTRVQYFQLIRCDHNMTCSNEKEMVCLCLPSSRRGTMSCSGLTSMSTDFCENNDGVFENWSSISYSIIQGIILRAPWLANSTEQHVWRHRFRLFFLLTLYW